MHRVLHKSNILQPGKGRRAGASRTGICLVFLLGFGAGLPSLVAGQGYPGQVPGGRGGMGQPGTVQPGGDIPPSTAVDKPDAAAAKAFKAAKKSLDRAREFEDVAAKATNPDKKSAALEKVSDAYNRALDQFTEALSNKGDMLDAWNDVGYVHLRLGAFSESIDDYNHALALKPDLLEAVANRGQAYLAVDRLDEAKAAYMDLFNHARPLADQLMVSMQKWLESHRSAANGMRPADIDSFGKWVAERDGIAKQTASASATPNH